jgi:hypothetical protein
MQACGGLLGRGLQQAFSLFGATLEVYLISSWDVAMPRSSSCRVFWFFQEGGSNPVIDLTTQKTV